ncbi:MAG TPA: hypothetical protein VF131_16980 [Blastocatellia bacterium]|nr:hypothetical protein [Blastocatellia bacterium]
MPLLKTKSIKVRLIVATLMIVGVLAAEHITKQNSPNKDDTKLKEVEHLFTNIPVYPGAQEVHASWSSKERLAGVIKTYKTEAGFNELKQYYTETLPRLGWHFDGEKEIKDWWRDLGGRELIFQAGEYYVHIQYAGDKADYAWNYAVSVGWRR